MKGTFNKKMEPKMIPFRELSLAFSSLDAIFQLYLTWRNYRRTCQKDQLYHRHIYQRSLYVTPLVFITAIFPLLFGLRPMMLYAIGRYICDQDVCDFFYPQFWIFSQCLWLYARISMFLIKLTNGIPNETEDGLKTELRLMGLDFLRFSFLYLLAEFYDEKLWIYLLIIYISIKIIVSFICPTLINLIIKMNGNIFTELPEGTLRTRLQKLVDRVNFPIEQIFIGKGECLPNSAVYLGGSLTKYQIIIKSGMILSFPEDEIEASVAHELGHWHHHHTNIMMVWNIIVITLKLYLGSILLQHPDLYLSFGYNIPVHPVIGLNLCLGIINLLNLPIQILTNFYARLMERQADRYAAELGYANKLSAALIRLGQISENNQDPDPLDVIINASHPPLYERITFCSKF
jgi:Zn-dependent protease with chaperone function